MDMCVKYFEFLCLRPPKQTKEAMLNPVVMSVVLSVGDVCDSVRDNPRISGTTKAREFKFCTHVGLRQPP